MCGISVIVTLDAVKSAQTATLEYKNQLKQEIDSSLSHLHHRGPDAQCEWISSDNRVVLGHVRFAINDLTAAGNQPFHELQNDIHVVVAGEIYNYKEIRLFTSQSDCEVIPHLYVKYGFGFLDHLVGEFSICLYDGRNRLLFAARDRFGTKPLFWTIAENRVLVASEVKAFLPLGAHSQWDLGSIYQEGYLYDVRTLLQSKHKAGHYLISPLSGFPEQRKWKRKLQWSRDQIVREVRRRLRESVRIRLPLNSRAAIPLSGGLDSSIIAGIASDLLKIDKGFGPKAGVVCYTICVDDDRYDETAIARRTAKWLGLRHVVVKISADTLARDFRDAVEKMEQTNPDLDFVGIQNLTKVMKDEGIRVSLNGVGADDFFGGYQNFLPDFLLDKETEEASIALNSGSREISSTVARAMAGTPTSYDGTECGSKMAEDSAARRMLNGSLISSLLWTNASLKSPWADWVSQRFGRFNKEQMRATIMDVATMKKLKKWHRFHVAQLVWVLGVLSATYLVALGDRPEMANSVEGRIPFLDHRLVEFVCRLPPSAKVRIDPETGCFRDKDLLHEVGRPYISDEVYMAQKKAYSAPPGSLWESPLKEELENLLTRENIEQFGFYDLEKVSQLKMEAFGDSNNVAAMRELYHIAQFIILSKL